MLGRVASQMGHPTFREDQIDPAICPPNPKAIRVWATSRNADEGQKHRVFGTLVSTDLCWTRLNDVVRHTKMGQFADFILEQKWAKRCGFLLRLAVLFVFVFAVK